MFFWAWALQFEQCQQSTSASAGLSPAGLPPTLGRLWVLGLGTKFGEQGCGKEGMHCQDHAWSSLAAS